MASYRFLRNKAILILNDENNTRVVYVRGNENEIEDMDWNLDILFEENFQGNEQPSESNLDVANESIQHDENGNCISFLFYRQTERFFKLLLLCCDHL